MNSMEFADEALSPSSHSRPTSIWASLLAGSTAGVAQVVVAQPLVCLPFFFFSFSLSQLIVSTQLFVRTLSKLDHN